MAKVKRKSLHEVSKILEATFNQSIKLIQHNVDLLGLGPIQSKKYFEAFAGIRSHRTSECYAGAGTGYEAAALQVIWGYHKKSKTKAGKGA